MLQSELQDFADPDQTVLLRAVRSGSALIAPDCLHWLYKIVCPNIYSVTLTFTEQITSFADQDQIAISRASPSGSALCKNLSVQTFTQYNCYKVNYKLLRTQTRHSFQGQSDPGLHCLYMIVCLNICPVSLTVTKRITSFADPDRTVLLRAA